MSERPGGITSQSIGSSSHENHSLDADDDANGDSSSSVSLSEAGGMNNKWVVKNGRRSDVITRNHKEELLLAASSHTAASSSSVTFDHSFTTSEIDSSEAYMGRFHPMEESLIEAKSEEGLEVEAHFNALNFVMEHRIFLKAALDLLTERDRHAPELGMMDPIILKSGSLKKASHLMNGVWKVKFVEIRRGMFSYYENAVSKDASGEGELLRKDVPLEANACHCRAVKLHQKALNLTTGGAIFELTVNGSKRLWMAKTREDRQVWMQTIHNAMVGGSLTRSDSLMDRRGNVWGVRPRSPFKSDLRKYLKAQSQIRNAKSRQEYLVGLSMVSNHSLKVPVKWIEKQGVLDGSNAFREEAVGLSVEQLWRDLQRDSVSINGELFRGDAGHGPERIAGALVREILTVAGKKSGDGTSPDLQESQALVYARDILLSGNRTRSGGDAYFCVNTLCANQDLVVVVPSGREVEPVIIEVVEDETDAGACRSVVEKSGWIKTKNKSQKQWRKLFFVLSEGTLSFYESALPRPHRLRGQIVLTDTTVQVSKLDWDPESKSGPQFVMTIVKEGVNRERVLLFASEDRLLDWTYALECSTKIRSTTDAPRKLTRRRSSQDDESSHNQPKVDILSQAGRSTKEHAIGIGLDDEAVENKLAEYAKRAATALIVSVRACTEYKVSTLDPQGDEREDTWAHIRAHFLQSFRINGGPNGRIQRGEEIVRLSFVDCIDVGADAQEVPEYIPSTPQRKRATERGIFRRFSTSEEVDDGSKAPIPPIE